jgi:hypothetical protein
MSEPKFELGALVATPAALRAIAESGQTPLDFLSRHVRGDWGDVDAHDRKCNDLALLDGTRLLSAYTTLRGVKLWIITDGTDDAGRRASTCILLPSEY